jgi:membrane-bound metal-dependent hydrolase YbcI (DUF457 family)
LNTYTHLLVTAACSEPLKRRGIPVHTRGVLLGSVMPDVPLIILTLGFFLYRRFVDPMPGEGMFPQLYDDLYFGNPLWIISHSFFHSPPMVALFAAVGYYGIRTEKSWGAALFWFAAACGLHSVIDILTHHNDGPLLLFPFNWEYRFITPISYWDSRHYGNIVGPLEHLMNLGIILYFVVVWVRGRTTPPHRPANCDT